MSKPFPGPEDSDVGFGADDEFSLDAADPWRTPALAPKGRPEDPFADVPADPYAAPDERLDPFATEPSRAQAQGQINPVGDLLANAEAALGQGAMSPSETGQGAMGQSASGQAATSQGAGGHGAMGEGALGEASVPRIAIHIFCERQDTAAVADKARRDRRMSRAQTTVQAGGLAAAVEF